MERESRVNLLRAIEAFNTLDSPYLSVKSMRAANRV
jgi:hypothetical protein